jgi:hypothetical protein
MADVAAMPQFTLHAEFGAQKRRRKLGDKFLGGVRRVSCPLQCPLCRYRHKTHNAGARIMPRGLKSPLSRAWKPSDCSA